MKKIVVSEFISLDGVIEAPGPDGSGYQYAGWTMPYGNEQFMKLKYSELMASDSLLVGRVTYEGFASAWPERQGDEFSDKMNNMPKYIVTKTLQSADWKNSHILSGDFEKEIAALKEEGDGNILVAGSGHLVRSLLDAGLVDEIRLMVYPVILGTGKQLFRESHKASLKLTHTEVFDTGIVVMEYKPEKS